MSDWEEEPLDVDTERAIIDLTVAAVRQFRGDGTKEETQQRTGALRKRIRTLVNDGSSDAVHQALLEEGERE